MAKKTTNPKPKQPSLPPNVKVKETHIDLSPKKWFSPLLLILIMVTIGWNFVQTTFSPNQVTEVGLNTIQAKYASGMYEEVVIAGDQIEARLAASTIVNGKEVKTVERSQFPLGTKITDL